MSFIKEQKEFESNFIIFKRPECNVKDFLVQSGDGQLHRLMEINSKEVFSQVVQSTVEEIERKIEYLPHYYRSKFSRDCSREETE